MTDTITPIPAYVYKVTCKWSGEYYFGFRAANIKHNRHPEDDLWVTYFTSSKIIKSLMQEHPITSFDAIVIAKYATADDAFWAEQQLIKDYIDDKLCLNRNYINKNNAKTVFHTLGRQLSPQQKINQSKLRTGIPLGPTKRKGRKTYRSPSTNFSESTKGTKWYNNGVIEKRCSSHPEGFKLGKLSKGRTSSRKGVPTGRKGVSNTVLKGRPQTKVSCRCCRRTVSIHRFAAHYLRCEPV